MSFAIKESIDTSLYVSRTKVLDFHLEWNFCAFSIAFLIGLIRS